MGTYEDPADTKRVGQWLDSLRFWGLNQPNLIEPFIKMKYWHAASGLCAAVIAVMLYVGNAGLTQSVRGGNSLAPKTSGEDKGSGASGCSIDAGTDSEDIRATIVRNYKRWLRFYLDVNNINLAPSFDSSVEADLSGNIAGELIVGRGQRHLEAGRLLMAEVQLKMASFRDYACALLPQVDVTIEQLRSEFGTEKAGLLLDDTMKAAALDADRLLQGDGFGRGREAAKK